jgi:hypothetical protein
LAAPRRATDVSTVPTFMPTMPPVQSLWIGHKLSTLEQLAIRSFLANGHDFHLYAYEAIAGVPKGATVLDAGRILPSSRIFRYTGNGSLAGFANFFRYKLLLESGGWWVDMDTVCLRPFDFDTEYVVSSEMHAGASVIDNAALKAPRGSALAEYAWSVCESKDPKSLRWGETGPRLLAEAVQHCGLAQYVRPPETFCPVPYRAWESVLSPDLKLNFGPETHAVHLWHELWRTAGQDKDARYPAGCLFETLKARYMPLSSAP